MSLKTLACRPGRSLPLDHSLRVHRYNWLPGSVVITAAAVFLGIGGAAYHGWRGPLSLLEHLATGILIAGAHHLRVRCRRRGRA
jgi:hypothetical protein